MARLAKAIAKRAVKKNKIFKKARVLVANKGAKSGFKK